MTRQRPEAESLSVLHYDADYDVLSQVMSFESAWLAPPGSLP